MLRYAKIEDLPRLVALEREGFPPEETFSEGRLRYLLTRAQGRIVVAEENGEILGFVVLLWRYRSTIGRIYDIVVSPAARGRGIGTALLREAERIARQRGLTALALEVRATNREARCLYEHNGFVPVVDLPNYYGEGVHAIRYRKTLDTTAATAKAG
ncbi:MAG: GNAT family N-acetyltransferase [Dehalococcoidia bacterium]|nr:GNAT family N-acetyltransferase [Dehalococcoidia bacterium]MDW8119378.1 N-acetyltransferase [Chloroflexota bacterium]